MADSASLEIVLTDKGVPPEPGQPIRAPGAVAPAPAPQPATPLALPPQPELAVLAGQLGALVPQLGALVPVLNNLSLQLANRPPAPPPAAPSPTVPAPAPVVLPEPRPSPNLLGPSTPRFTPPPEAPPLTAVQVPPVPPPPPPPAPPPPGPPPPVSGGGAPSFPIPLPVIDAGAAAGLGALATAVSALATTLGAKPTAPPMPTPPPGPTPFVLPNPLPVIDVTVANAINRIGTGFGTGTGGGGRGGGGGGPPKPKVILTEEEEALSNVLKQMYRDEIKRMQDTIRRSMDPEYAAKMREKDEAEAKKARKNDPEYYYMNLHEEITAQREAEEKQRMRARMRAQIDPEFARRYQRQEEGRRLSEFRQSTPVRIAEAAGAGGITNAIGAFAMGGPAGAAVAAVGMLADSAGKAASAVGGIAQAVAEMNPEGVARGFVNLAGSIPLVGGAISGLLGGLLDLSNGINETARRLGQYNPLLAIQQTGIDLRNMFRDMERSFRLGPDLLRAVDARQQLNERIQELIDRYAPALLRFVTGIFEGIESLVEWASKLYEALQGAGNAIVGGMSYAQAQQAIAERRAQRTLDQIAENTLPAEAATAFFDMLFAPPNIGNVPGNARPNYNPNSAFPLGGF